jgi:E3 ubiquitin-protein ligase makorin
VYCHCSKICTFFLQGLCRYGNSCFYSHSLNERIESEDEMIAIGEEIRLSKELECGICYDNIMAKEERFGLLSGCNHAFCLTCVRNWRGHADQPKQTVRQCPVCRIETHFIIPSSRMVTNPERKKALIDEYRVRAHSLDLRVVDLDKRLPMQLVAGHAEKPVCHSLSTLQRGKASGDQHPLFHLFAA